MSHSIIHNIIPANSLWTDWKDLATGFALLDGSGEDIAIADAQLCEVDYRLPAAIRMLKLRELPEHKATSAITTIQTLLALWDNPFRVQCRTSELLGLKDINYVTFQKTMVSFYATGFEYTDEFCDELGETISIPTGTLHLEPKVKTAWLNEFYPGWKERVTLAKDLDINLSFMLLHMFNALPNATNVKLSVNVPVDFDELK